MSNDFGPCYDKFSNTNTDVGIIDHELIFSVYSLNRIQFSSLLQQSVIGHNKNTRYKCGTAVKIKFGSVNTH